MEATLQGKHGFPARHPGLWSGEQTCVGCIFWSIWDLACPGLSVCRLPAGQPSEWEAGQAGGRICHLLLHSGDLLFQINLDIFN